MVDRLLIHPVGTGPANPIPDAITHNATNRANNNPVNEVKKAKVRDKSDQQKSYITALHNRKEKNRKQAIGDEKMLQDRGDLKLLRMR